MPKINLTSAEAAAVEMAIDDRVADCLRGLANARCSVRAAIDVGATPDEDDQAAAEFYRETIKQLRAVLAKLHGAEGGETDGM